MIRVLSASSECAPLVKTGGLADVAGALPGALAGQGVEMRTLLPGYPGVLAQLGGAETMLAQNDLFGGPARVLAGRAGGLDLLVLEAAHLYERDGGPYLDAHGRDWPDNPERFAALSLVAARLAATGAGDWKPDIVHCHDWQTGLAPYYLARRFEGAAASVLTIHNIAFHGLAPADRIGALGLEAADFTSEGFEYWGQVGALKAGLVWADRLTTVSPTYAEELRRPEFGMGLDGMIAKRGDDLTGILNGIDTAVWNPARDPHAPTFGNPRGKARAVRALRAELGLPEVDGPLAVVISRLSHQKGLDLLLEALPSYLEAGGQLALLGSGDRGLEAAWREAGERHEGLSVTLGYDEPLSHRLIAGGDAVLVPSRFEPCGLTQLYGLRYGTIPLVARTGGLADTVIDANDAGLRARCATGLQVAPLSAETLSLALHRLVALHADRGAWRMMVRNAMRHPVGWDVSAEAYAGLYAALAAAP